MIRLFDLKQKIDEFVESGGSDLREIDRLTGEDIEWLSENFDISPEVYRAYCYQYFIEQKLYNVSKKMRKNGNFKTGDITSSDINAIHRFCCKSKEAEKNMYDKIQNLQYLKTVNAGGQLC